MSIENNSSKRLAGYFPVISRGYTEFIDNDPNAEIGVFDESLLALCSYLKKDIRALEPQTAVRFLQGIGRNAMLLSADNIHKFSSEHKIILPDDDISHRVVAEYAIEPVDFSPVFLRWDRQKSTTDQMIEPDLEVSLDSSDPNIQNLIASMTESTNWWRQVGAQLMTPTGQTINTHNSSVPTEYSSVIDGDPRITARRGEAIERSIDIHAEAKLIATCARDNISTEGSAIYVSTFPCANCAKLIANSGISECYYVDGYATVDGATILKANNVRLIHIDTELPSDTPRSKPIPYPN